MAAILSYLAGRLALTRAQYASITWRYNGLPISRSSFSVAENNHATTQELSASGRDSRGLAALPRRPVHRCGLVSLASARHRLGRRDLGGHRQRPRIGSGFVQLRRTE